jgi:hypothetical protein
MSTSRVAIQFLTLCLLCFSSFRQEAFADNNELQFIIKTTTARPVETVSVTPENGNPIECSFPEKTTAKRVYSCKIPKITELGTYDLHVEGGELQIDIKGIRVNPAMTNPTIIVLDLTDDVFSKDFASPSGYYTKWNKVPINHDLSPYLITRNYFLKTEGDKPLNTGNANILKKWLAQALQTAEHLPYQPVDDQALQAWKKFKAEGKHSSDAQKVFDQYLASLQPDLDRLQIADWSILKRSLSASDFGKRQEDFCELWRLFASKWEESDLQTKNNILSTWGISEKMMKDRDSLPPFKACPPS